MTLRFVEIIVAAASLAALVATILHFQADFSHYGILVLTTVWGVWVCSRLDLPDYPRYALALGILLPVNMVAHMLYDGYLYALAAFPVLVRSGMLLSLHRRVWDGCLAIARDMKGISGR